MAQNQVCRQRFHSGSSSIPCRHKAVTPNHALSITFEAFEIESRITINDDIMDHNSTETMSRECRLEAFDFNHHDLESFSFTLDSDSNACSHSLQYSSSPKWAVSIAGVLSSKLVDERTSSAPIFIHYFAIHESVVMICGGLYWLFPDIGAVCISIVPGLSILSLFTHFLCTKFPSNRVHHIFHSPKHYFVAFAVFVIGACSIFLIYRLNLYLVSYLPSKISNGVQMNWISNILKFPYNHSMLKVDPDKRPPFNLPMSFAATIIAPIVEETFKYGLVCLTLHIPFLWRFHRNRYQFTESEVVSTSSTRRRRKYCVESLFIIFIGICGGCGIAVMENIGYLAACQWKSTQSLCLPNKNEDILGAGLARGIFSVPFHCVTAGIMADVLCSWINSQCIDCIPYNRVQMVFKLVLSYPISIAGPVLLHSNFNYWMKGWTFMTCVLTMLAMSILVWRIGRKHWIIINGEKKNMEVSIDSIRDIKCDKKTMD